MENCISREIHGTCLNCMSKLISRMGHHNDRHRVVDSGWLFLGNSWIRRIEEVTVTRCYPLIRRPCGNMRRYKDKNTQWTRFCYTWGLLRWSDKAGISDDRKTNWLLNWQCYWLECTDACVDTLILIHIIWKYIRYDRWTKSIGFWTLLHRSAGTISKRGGQGQHSNFTLQLYSCT